MDSIVSMRVFVRVAELGGFAQAAREFNLSPSMVAKHVQALEARLGARLLNRTTRRQNLTEVGRLYFERSKSILIDFDSAEASAMELQAAPRGLLRVTAPVVFGSCGLTPLLPRFLAEYPEVRIDLALHDRVVDLVEEGFDAALRSGPLADVGLVARPLASLRTILCAAPSYLQRHGTPKRPADLVRHQCLGFTYLRDRDRWRLIGPGGEDSVKVNSRLGINNGEALRQAALAGGGIVMLSELLLKGDVQSGALVRVLSSHAPPSRPAHLLYLPDRRPTPKLQRFVEFVLQHLGPKRVLSRPR
jgi:DNA-binding transcriptional LysR family regulator